MAQLLRIPNIRTYVDPLLGASYAEWTCWELVRHLLQEGFALDIVKASPHAAAPHVAEVWYRGDPQDPLSLAQSWDLAIFACQDALPWSDHVGLVIDQATFVHARTAETGVAIERLRRWRPKLLQLARLRRLL